MSIKKKEKRYAKRSLKRRERPIRCKILIVCEGTKTEPNYFNAFKLPQEPVVYDIETKGLGKNPMSVVGKAIDLKNENDYDRVWSVFDKDAFSDQLFNDAINKAESNKVGCAWSNEAFELWFLYHFVNRTTGMNREEYKKAISDAVNNSPNFQSKTRYVYAKNDKDNYRVMTEYGSMDNAIKYAEEMSKKYTDKRYATHNPCTMVFKLVRQLIGQDEELNEELKRKVDS
jgi:hypothetical protein